MSDQRGMLFPHHRKSPAGLEWMLGTFFLYNSDKPRNASVMQDNIPHFYQYGESEAAEELEFVHASKLFSRIKEYNWEIKPHRHDSLHQIFLLLDGSIETRLETQQLTLQAPSILVVPAGHVHGFQYDESARGLVTTVADGFLRKACDGDEWSWISKLLDEIFICRLSSPLPQETPLVAYLQDIEREYRFSAPGRLQIVAALLKLVFIHLGRNLELQRVMTGDSSHYVQIFDSFRKLVDTYYTGHMRVSGYCRLLSINERKLNRVCKALTGAGPSTYIHRHLIQEAKRHLIYTHKPVAQVCFELGFSDPAYFSRFFSRHTGYSPRDYCDRYRKALTG
ncbi:helix-turn-helix domain-containing protein [Parahaliea mediterranea]|uniref:Helix-turn-helix domain-containing protein n=1 Tax=Parahaliea mediterranea TaxID=651086 RepID=A0A939DG82_9GAMM|nr:helix-turn-helix domain-containing protein [Parahaliea mediterranea]MBN7797601.1 helix-turn-helix domain-containing protein [Parahaliea mediterranea]